MSKVSAGKSLMTLNEVEKALNRSRASIYRYANTDGAKHDPGKLNPEPRTSKGDRMLFDSGEVERFAKDVLGVREVAIVVQESPEDATQALLRSILIELQALNKALSAR